MCVQNLGARHIMKRRPYSMCTDVQAEGKTRRQRCFAGGAGGSFVYSS
jgi:hypothetical protein